MTTRRVAVFGAGVTGLTVAHELIERGYDVTVYEPEPDIIGRPGSCAVGGLAATQWSAVTVPRGPAVDAGPQVPMQAARDPVPFVPVTIRFQPNAVDLDGEAEDQVAWVTKVLAAHPHLKIEITAWMENPGGGRALPVIDDPPNDGRVERLDWRRAAAVRDALGRRGLERERFGRVIAGGLGLAHELDRHPEQRAYVEIRSHEVLIPGEHGFRFFPSFYRHLFDTMRRTPASESQPPHRFTERTVFEKVVPTYSVGVNFEEGPKSFVLPRRRITSIQSLFDLVREAYDAMGFGAADVMRFSMKLFKYATSCAARRGEYEGMSWWDFVEGARYSPRFRRYIETSPQLLVAMRASVSDARTIGNIAIQLLMDQLLEAPRPDGTLMGPTTLAWLEHWRRYLEYRGVRFELGALEGFWGAPEDLQPIVRLAGREPRNLAFDYVTVAVSVQAAQALVRARDDLRGGDFDRIRALDLGRRDEAVPGGTVDHLSGIQYYFRSAVRFVPGHTAYPDSAWGLSSIFQPQFWWRPRGWWEGDTAVLTVDVGDWHTVSPVLEKSAWEATDDEVACEVWRQIKATLRDADRVPEPSLYHLDRNLRRREGRPRENSTPLLINVAGDYERRPGDVGGYRLYGARVVFAGTYMKTYTRLTTMESANESARHAVNAILREDGFRGDCCETVDPERHEFQDLRWLVELDHRLWQAGLPHMVDILDSETTLDALTDPRALARRLAEVAARLGLWPPGVRVEV